MKLFVVHRWWGWTVTFDERERHDLENILMGSISIVRRIYVSAWAGSFMIHDPITNN